MTIIFMHHSTWNTLLFYPPRRNAEFNAISNTKDSYTKRGYGTINFWLKFQHGFMFISHFVRMINSKAPFLNGVFWLRQRGRWSGNLNIHTLFQRISVMPGSFFFVEVLKTWTCDYNFNYTSKSTQKKKNNLRYNGDSSKGFDERSLLVMVLRSV